MSECIIRGGVCPEGTISLTDTSETDVTTYKYAKVEDANLVEGNIKSGTSILGVLGTLKSYTPTYKNIGITPDTFSTSGDALLSNKLSGGIVVAISSGIIGSSGGKLSKSSGTGTMVTSGTRSLYTTNIQYMIYQDCTDIRFKVSTFDSSKGNSFLWVFRVAS